MFYYGEYLIAMLLCMAISAIASGKVKRAYAKYDKVRCRSGMTGYETAARLLRNNQAADISLGRVSGTLSDHYNPGRKIVNLSESTYDSSSVAAVAVAAHEIGHVMQKKAGYVPYQLRTAIVPVVNFGSRLAMPLVLIGLLLDTGVRAAGETSLGFTLAMIGVALYGLSFVFALVTLPVEFNASARAKQMLLEEGILSQEELPGAKAVLSAAAMTYVASLLVSLISFLRFLLYVLSIFGRRSRR